MGTFVERKQSLVQLIREIGDIEQRAISKYEFKDITVNDIHVISAIGLEKPKNMTTIAKELSVTVGTLTIAMNSLVKKEYVKRERGKLDRRVVYISLSEKGKQIYSYLESFYDSMLEEILRELNSAETDAFFYAMDKINTWLGRENDR